MVIFGDKRRAVSLLEVMLALGLISTAVLAIMSVYTLGLRQSTRTEKVLEATETGRALMERVKEVPFDDIPDNDIVFDGRNGDPQVGTFPPPPYPTQGEMESVVTVDQLGPQLKGVHVRVFYDEGRSVDFQTYFRPQ